MWNGERGDVCLSSTLYVNLGFHLFQILYLACFLSDNHEQYGKAQLSSWIDQIKCYEFIFHVCKGCNLLYQIRETIFYVASLQAYFSKVSPSSDAWHRQHSESKRPKHSNFYDISKQTSYLKKTYSTMVRLFGWYDFTRSCAILRASMYWPFDWRTFTSWSFPQKFEDPLWIS